MIGTFLFFVNLFLWFGIFSLPLLLLYKFLVESLCPNRQEGESELLAVYELRRMPNGKKEMVLIR